MIRQAVGGQGAGHQGAWGVAPTKCAGTGMGTRHRHSYGERMVTRQAIALPETAARVQHPGLGVPVSSTPAKAITTGMLASRT